MYSEDQLNAKIAEATNNIKSVEEQAKNEHRRIREKFEMDKQQFETDMAKLNADANSLIGEQKGKLGVYQDLLNELFPKENLPKDESQDVPLAVELAKLSPEKERQEESGNLIGDDGS